MQSLNEIKGALVSRLGSQSLFRLINTRIILRTGVDLSAIKVDEDRNPDSVGKVTKVLETMGYAL